MILLSSKEQYDTEFLKTKRICLYKSQRHKLMEVQKESLHEEFILKKLKFRKEVAFELGIKLQNLISSYSPHMNV